MHPLVTVLVIAQAVTIAFLVFVLGRRIKNLDEALSTLVDMTQAIAAKNVSTTGAQRVMRRAQ